MKQNKPAVIKANKTANDWKLEKALKLKAEHLEQIKAEQKAKQTAKQNAELVKLERQNAKERDKIRNFNKLDSDTANLETSQLELYKLQKLLERLDKPSKKINDKKRLKNIWQDMGLDVRTEYEKVIDYFFNCIMNGQTETIKTDYINSRFLTVKELKQIGEQTPFVMKHQTPNLLETLTNKQIIQELWDANKQAMFEFSRFVYESEQNKLTYKRQLLETDSETPKETKANLYKNYQSKQNNINNKIRNRQNKLKEYEYITADELTVDEITAKLDGETLERYKQAKRKPQTPKTKRRTLEQINAEQKKRQKK